jgi:hypothetical protein
MEPKRKSGRPKKAEHEKVQYQRIAVYLGDYQKLSAKLDELNESRPKTERLKLTDAFTDMVANYTKK